MSRVWYPGGYNNWFSVSVDQPGFEFRINHGIKNPRTDTEAVASDTAILLANEWHDKPLYLALSGGIDSEYVARILTKNKIPFTPVILKINNFNNAETWYAEYWCYLNKVTPVILNYSIEEYSKAYIKFFPKMRKFKNYSQTPLMIIYDYIKQAGGYGIVAAGDVNIAPTSKRFWGVSLEFISNIVDIGDHPTSFLLYTPELAYSYINQFDENLSDQYNKLSFYNVPARPKIDYSTSLHNNPVISPIQDKLFFMHKLDQDTWEPIYWYGTKEEILQQLIE